MGNMERLRQTRFATRFLLIPEIILGWMSITWAAAALFGIGTWRDALIGMSGTYQWAWMLFVAGAFQIVTAMLELVVGRFWSDCKLQWAAEARHFIGFFSLILWVTLMYAYFVFPRAASAIAPVWQGLFCIFAQAIIVINNRRLAVLLDPTIPTEKLRAKLLKARDEGRMVL